MDRLTRSPSDQMASMERELQELREAKQRAEARASRAEAELRASRSGSRDSSSSSSSSYRTDSASRESRSMRSESSSSRAAGLEADLRELRLRKSRSGTSSSSSGRSDSARSDSKSSRSLSGSRGSESTSRPDSYSRDRTTSSRKSESRSDRERHSSRASTSRESDTAVVAREEARLASSSARDSLSSRTSKNRTMLEMEAEKRRLKAELKGDTRNLRTELEVERTKARRRRGIDICFLVDCTGSMEPWIAEVKNKVRDIARASSRFCNEGIVRSAFCGYRDIGDPEQYINVDFTEIDRLREFEDRVGRIQAGGGGDMPEDVVGGLRQVLEQSWYASTRVVIHIADAPCHGREYHDGHDSYPEGDPSGIKPEQLLKQLRDKRTHYFFIEITPYTRTMTTKFSSLFSSSQHPIFEVRALGDHPDQLLPQVIESVKSSVQRSSTADRFEEFPALWT